MSKQRLKGIMSENTWERIKQGRHTPGGSFDTPAGERWLALNRVRLGKHSWELSDAGVVDLPDVPYEDPDHGPNPFTMPMPDSEWEKIQGHTPDPHTGLLGRPNHPTYKIVAVIDAPKAKAKAVEVE